ncbi:MAG: amidase family protein [Bacillota bacterium]|nr:amidase family protein [Bacillota bacterium]
MKEYTLDQLRRKLERGTVTSRDLVRMYLKQSDPDHKIGPALNAVATTNPEAFKDADRLDRERAKGRVRGPLHGIPVMLKDNINTKGAMPTTASSFALADLYTDSNAFIVKKLRKAGAIILGKTNLSEWAYFMSTDKMPSGFGSLNGQVKSPYGDKIDPLGSSTGSAVAVAANMIPVAVGTETNGSLTAPAKQNMIATIKPTLGLVSRTGIIPITHLQDTAGPLGRTVKDCALLLEAISGSDSRDRITKTATKKWERYSEACGKPIKGMKIGFLAFTNYPDDDIEKELLTEAKTLFEQAGATVIDLSVEAARMNNYYTMIREFKADLNSYLKSVEGKTPIKSLSDVIAFNAAHAERCLVHGQNILIEAEQYEGGPNDPEYREARRVLLEQAHLPNDLMREHKLDLIVSAKRTGYAPIAGSPCMSVPARPLTDDNPRNLNLIGKKWKESDLIKIASFYERSAVRRVPPNFKVK